MTDCGEEVVGCERFADLGRVEVKRSHAVGFQPNAHGEGASAEEIGSLNAFEGG